MNYQENSLTYEEYCSLRESVGWKNFPKIQIQEILKRSLYTVVAYKNHQAVGMGRLIGDGLYYVIVDVVVRPDCQQMGIGSKIFEMIVEYVDSKRRLVGAPVSN